MIHININPVLLQWGAITIGWHGLWIAAGVVVAFQVAVLEGRRKGISPDHFKQLFIWTVMLGLIGARLLYVLDRWKEYIVQPGNVLAIQGGGFAVYGGLIGGTLAVLGYARWKRLSFWCLVDAIAPGIPVGEIVGRVGCVINGDVWGVPTHSWWGLVYDHPGASIPAAMLGVPTFPTPIALQVWNLCLLGLLMVLRNRLRQPGSLFLTGAIGYGVGRFIVSIWEARDPLVFGLKQTQVVSLGVIGLVILLLYWRNAATRVDESRQKPSPLG